MSEVKVLTYREGWSTSRETQFAQLTMEIIDVVHSSVNVLTRHFTKHSIGRAVLA